MAERINANIAKIAKTHITRINSLVLNSKKALDSGCNLILYCGGKIEESKKILKSLDKIDNFTEKKTKQFYEFLR